MTVPCLAIFCRVRGSAFRGRHKSSSSKHEAPVRRESDWGFSQTTARKRGRVTVCHRRGPNSATKKTRSENASSSTTYIYAETAICFLWLVRFQYGIDSADRPGHENRLTLPSGSEPEPSIDDRRLNAWSLFVNT